MNLTSFMAHQCKERFAELRAKSSSHPHSMDLVYIHMNVSNAQLGHRSTSSSHSNLRNPTSQDAQLIQVFQWHPSMKKNTPPPSINRPWLQRICVQLPCPPIIMAANEMKLCHCKGSSREPDPLPNREGRIGSGNYVYNASFQWNVNCMFIYFFYCRAISRYTVLFLAM